jgi:hypothetical protein
MIEKGGRGTYATGTALRTSIRLVAGALQPEEPQYSTKQYEIENESGS